jgi:hypothetical protein
MSFPNDERSFRTDVQQNNMMAIQAMLQKQLTDRSATSPEQRFYQQSLQLISNLSGMQVELDTWTVTAFEVDMGPEIGSGGLYVIQFQDSKLGLLIHDEQWTSSQRNLEQDSSRTQGSQDRTWCCPTLHGNCEFSSPGIQAYFFLMQVVRLEIEVGCCTS